MTAASARQADFILSLANKLTGESAAYVSQSSVLAPPRNGWTAAAASALIDELQAAITAHAAWQDETGIVPGAKIRRHFTSKDGRPLILSGEVTGYRWDGGLAPDSVFVDLDDESREAFGPKARSFGIARIGAPVTPDAAALKAERARLAARIAEIDAALAG